ncbi:hypothetical protein Taro_027109 [Colocasia esculenta]|uniref:Uncharacterized protein n=1 Tax=Colocasia esculenta TaxID=4460 RepID=A0A843VTB6_COLES|nr:hypothetical protein [Colocasia esculenta]
MTLDRRAALVPAKSGTRRRGNGESEKEEWKSSAAGYVADISTLPPTNTPLSSTCCARASESLDGGVFSCLLRSHPARLPSNFPLPRIGLRVVSVFCRCWKANSLEEGCLSATGVVKFEVLEHSLPSVQLSSSQPEYFSLSSWIRYWVNRIRSQQQLSKAPTVGPREGKIFFFILSPLQLLSFSITFGCMSPQPVVLDISSDEEDAVFDGSGKDSLDCNSSLDWLSKMLELEDEPWESKDVVDVDELNCTAGMQKLSSVGSFTAKLDSDDDSDDDCKVLDDDPDNPVEEIQNEGNGSDELLIVGEKGQSGGDTRALDRADRVQVCHRWRRRAATTASIWLGDLLSGH